MTLRPVTPADREVLQAGFDALSQESRAQRFLAPVAHLSAEQLRYFTEVDQVDHVAWGALNAGGAGLGVGRWVRLRDEPNVAEFSLTVVDAAQGRGLGRLLFAVLCEIALERDVSVLRGIVARNNDHMVNWMRGIGARPTSEDPPDDGAITLDYEVDQSVEPATASARRLREARALVRAARGNAAV